MSIITFWNGTKEQCGNTASALALATYMAIERNIKILFVSTSLKDYSVEDSFWIKKKNGFLSMLGGNPGIISQAGIEGLDRIIRSKKLTPEIITDYSRIVLKNRLELLLGVNSSEAQYEEIRGKYPSIIGLADKYYDLVVIDLDLKLGPTIQENILKKSDIIIGMIPQKLKEIEKVVDKIQKNPYIKEKIMLTIGKYDDKTKYNAKNISRNVLKQKNIINTVPYNSLYFEAMQEGKVIDLFLNFLRLTDMDRNYEFISEIQRLAEDVKEKIRMAPRKREL